MGTGRCVGRLVVDTAFVFALNNVIDVFVLFGYLQPGFMMYVIKIAFWIAFTRILYLRAMNILKKTSLSVFRRFIKYRYVIIVVFMHFIAIY